MDSNIKIGIPGSPSLPIYNKIITYFLLFCYSGYTFTAGENRGGRSKIGSDSVGGVGGFLSSKERQ
jgi:hypothetical protein